MFQFIVFNTYRFQFSWQEKKNLETVTGRSNKELKEGRNCRWYYTVCDDLVKTVAQVNNAN
jgi:hypothetical protein